MFINSNVLTFSVKEGAIAVREKIAHVEKKGSTLMWFILSIIPLANFYFFWKLAENLSGHEKLVDKYEFLGHRQAKGNTLYWFVPIPAIYIGVVFLVSFIAAFYYLSLYSWYDWAYTYGWIYTTIGLFAVLLIVAIPIVLYIVWKTAELISGHEKIYKEKEALEHKGKKDSTFLWFIVSMIPIGNLYFLWKAAEIISGHEKTLGAAEPEHQAPPQQASVPVLAICPKCHARISADTKFCTECGANLKPKK